MANSKESEIRNAKRLLDMYKYYIRSMPNHFEKFIDFIGELEKCGIKHKTLKPLLKKAPMHGETPKEVTTACNMLQNFSATYGLSSIFDGIESGSTFVPTTFINPDDVAIQDITQISTECIEGTLKIPRDSEDIIFKLPVNMYFPDEDLTHSFGIFTIYMRRANVLVEKYQDNKSVNGYYHPYVKDSRLCLGEHKTPYEVAMRQLRFYDAYMLVMNALTTYGGDKDNTTSRGPHQSLLNWTGVRCVICDEPHKIDKTHPCSVTKRNICEKCAQMPVNIDDYTGLTCVPFLLEVCEQCKKRTLKVRKNEEGVNICPKCRLNNKE